MYVPAWMIYTTFGGVIAVCVLAMIFLALAIKLVRKSHRNNSYDRAVVVQLRNLVQEIYEFNQTRALGPTAFAQGIQKLMMKASSAELMLPDEED